MCYSLNTRFIKSWIFYLLFYFHPILYVFLIFSDTVIQTLHKTEFCYGRNCFVFQGTLLVGTS